MGASPSWTATVTSGLKLFNRSAAAALATNTHQVSVDSRSRAGHRSQKVKQTELPPSCSLQLKPRSAYPSPQKCKQEHVQQYKDAQVASELLSILGTLLVTPSRPQGTHEYSFLSLSKTERKKKKKLLRGFFRCIPSSYSKGRRQPYQNSLDTESSLCLFLLFLDF